MQKEQTPQIPDQLSLEMTIFFIPLVQGACVTHERFGGSLTSLQPSAGELWGSGRWKKLNKTFVALHCSILTVDTEF